MFSNISGRIRPVNIEVIYAEMIRKTAMKTRGKSDSSGLNKNIVFKDEKREAVVLVDVANVFNSLNREVFFIYSYYLSPKIKYK